ncbi:acyltransferase family protein [Streptomyces sp. SAS_270]|uniref:acyltransferase family protein n=1 Tax=Streptomyces sp. SAS_270 TaxID=3412748 RepID=UPI00403CB17D
MAEARVEPAVAGVRPQRRPELDALRMLVVIGLVFFHSALVFDTEDDFYVKNAETSDVPTIVGGLGVVWAMPMLFLVAGFGAWHSLHRRGPAGFAVERLRRLGVPLLFALVTLLPVPQWLRRRAADPGYHESYRHFWPRFFDVHLEPAKFPFVVQGEDFETGHLWFVLLLLVFSLVPALLVLRLPRGLGRRALDRLAGAVRRRGVILLPTVPVALICALVGLEKNYAAWHRWAYLLFFLYGFVVAADERFRTAMRRDAGWAAGLGLLLYLAALPGFLAADDPFTDRTALAIGARALYGAAGWCWLVGILGLLDRRGRRPARTDASPLPAAEGPPDRRTRVYGYLAAAVLPLYVLHQPIVVAVAYGVVGWDAPVAVKYVVIVAASLALTVAAYDLLVRRTRVTRFLVGMRA